MTIGDMHIEFDQSNGQVGANRNRKYNAGEKDWILNKCQERLIQSSISPKKDGTGGFELNQLYADRIRPLIVSNAVLPAYIDPGKNRYKVFLPADYAYLLSDWSYTSILCGGVTPQTSSQSLNLYALRQNFSNKNTAPFYQTLVVGFPNSVNIPADLSYIHKYTGLPTKQDVSSLTNYISLKGNYYWERFGDIVKPNHYLLATEDTIAPTMNIDGQDNTTVSSTVLDLQYHTTSDPVKEVDNRLMPSNKVSTTKDTAFYKTSHYSPISELSGQTLYIYSDSSFIVTQVGITYVRKCAPLSLSLGSNSELPEQFHQQICDLATEYVKGRLQNVPGTQLVANDNNTRVEL